MVEKSKKDVISYEIVKDKTNTGGEFATYTFIIKRKKTLRKRFDTEPTVVLPLDDVLITSRYSLLLMWKENITPQIERWVADTFPPKKYFGT